MFSLGGVRVFATTLIVAVHVVTMVLTTIVVSAGGSAFLESLQLSGEAVVRHGRIWQLVTYPFVNPPSFSFAWNMLILFFCGRELEQYFGRRAFLGLYAGMILVSAASMLVYAAIGPAGLSGCWLPHFAVFAAYVFVFPRMVFFWIPIIWIGVISFAIYALQFIESHYWPGLFALCVSTAAAWVWTKWQRGHFHFRLPVREKPARPKALPPDMDALLDKIGREGLHSLTAKERAQLGKAREDLLRK